MSCGLRRLAIAVQCAFILAAQNQCAHRPSKGAVTIAAPITAWTWPMYIAKEGGYYDKYGLNVKLLFANHPAGVAMLASGEADVNVNSLQQAMLLALKHRSLRVLGSPVKKWLFALIAQKDIKSMQDLRGRRLGVAQLGDSTYNYAISLIEKFGLTSNDVEFVTIGAEGRIPALTGSRVDATMLSAPAYFALEKIGYRSLANIIDHDDIYTPSVLLLEERTITQFPKLPELLIKAHAEAVKRFYEDKAFAIECFLKYDKQDRGGVEQVYEAYTQREAFERAPYISQGAIDYVIASAPDFKTAAQMRRFDYSAAIENRTVERLQQEGFFAQLFGPELPAR